MAVVFAALSLVLTACGDDDEPGSGNGGSKVTFAYEGAITETLIVEDATWESFSQAVIGTGHYDLASGATFAAHFGDDESFNVAYLQFQTREAVVQGQKLAVDNQALFFGDTGTGVRNQEIGGDVNVKKISGDKIILEFKDFSFLRQVNSNGKTQKVTVNGTITYTNDD